MGPESFRFKGAKINKSDYFPRTIALHFLDLRMQQIKNIIFDLGGIFLNINFSKTETAFVDLGIKNFSQLYAQHHSSHLFELLETGKISPEEFHQAFVKESGVHLSYEQTKTAWNALLLDFPVERLDWLNEIRKRFNTYLLSNTNKIHYEAFTRSFREQTGIDDFNEYFIKAYYSHEMGLRKPNTDAFLHILNEQNLKTGETLFIDDTLINIEGAKKVGLQTIYLAPPKTVLDLTL